MDMYTTRISNLQILPSPKQSSGLKLIIDDARSGEKAMRYG